MSLCKINLNAATRLTVVGRGTIKVECGGERNNIGVCCGVGWWKVRLLGGGARLKIGGRQHKARQGKAKQGRAK